MPSLPARFVRIFLAFAPLFNHRSWRHAQLLLIGAVPVPRRRAVTNVPRTTGCRRNRHFVNLHRMLSRACSAAIRMRPRIASFKIVPEQRARCFMRMFPGNYSWGGSVGG